MNISNTYSAFHGDALLCTGSLAEVALTLKESTSATDSVLIFHDQTGRQIDIDTSGTVADVQQRYAPSKTVKKAGRPKLGVISREVTLQQKHWEWLERQNSSASAIIRKLIDQELNNPESESNIMLARQAADHFMSVMVGNMPGYEEASRALYQGNKAVFMQLTERYPADLKAYIHSLTASTFLK